MCDPCAVPVSLCLRGGKDEVMAEVAAETAYANEAAAPAENSRFSNNGEQYPKCCVPDEKWPRAAEFKTIADKMRKARKKGPAAGPTVKEMRTALKP